VDGGIASIDPLKLERDPANNCAPVYGWDFVRTNTIFGVIHAARGYTAWSDKHPAYSSVSGHGTDGKAVDFRSQTTRFTASLRSPPDRHQLHRVSLRWHVTAPHGELPENTEKSADSNLALR
jgi:hypothetical protein